MWYPLSHLNQTYEFFLPLLDLVFLVKLVAINFFL
jgi:hypothetical protein